jgi:predicted 2-oxoglutarate/Fe(II)-dependent dioxygenase YbiX
MHAVEVREDVALVRGFLPDAECAELIAVMREAPRVQALVVRAGESILDPSLRNCFDHHCPDEVSRRVGRRLLTSFGLVADRLGTDADALYGPYFMSYEQGSFFRCHRDVANHQDDPARLASHRWSMIVYLNGRSERAGLPIFDGGSLIIYTPSGDPRQRRTIVIPEPGLLVMFRSYLLHEVAMITEGVRYAIAGWMARPDDAIMKEAV